VNLALRRGRIPAPVARLLSSARHEIVPVRSVEAHLDDLAQGSTVTVTSSARLGLERTLECTERLAGRGFVAVPHLAARDVHDEAGLRRVLERLDAAGVRDVFVIGGDGDRPSGRYGSGVELVEAVARLQPPSVRIGVAAHPEGHPVASDAALVEALLHKQRHAHYMTSQICFDPAVLHDWLRRVRGAGVHLPLYIGIPGAVRRAKLLELSFKLGVGPSLRYLAQQHGLITSLARPGTYTPATVVAGVSSWLADPHLRVAGFQVFTFNEVERTVAWERRTAATATT
jgi:methylenetetrahydrofolate reductase (NADPH)